MREYFIWLLKFITVFVMIFLIFPLFMVAILSLSGESIEAPAASKNNVAVIELAGVITDSREVVEQLHKQVGNKRVKGVVLRIDSPGGAVGPSQDIYEAVRTLKSKKPIVASMGAVAASGGLYAAVGASKVFAQPGTITGSIGVILQVPNFRRVAEMLGVEMVTIKSGELKDVGNSFRDMTPNEKQFLESTVNAAHDGFIAAVAEGRGLDLEQVKKFSDGRIILGSQAQELKLIDGFGDTYAAARAVFDLLGESLPEGEYPHLVYPQDKFRELKAILSGVEGVVRPLFSRDLSLWFLMR